jgi:poly(3-hydroxybutyrate) depolymerase
MHTPKNIQKIIRLIEGLSLETLQTSLANHNYDLSGLDLQKIKKALWQKYVQEQTQNADRKREYAQSSISFGDKTMRYVATTKGSKPAQGYPLYIALHGGGGAPASLNDSQWRAMQRYYLSCVDNGVYVAPRGVTNTWNLHFVDESYPLYDRLIENMVLFGGVDPNRVYLLGYSAGGDGVYQIAPRMPDRWAAANMSAGHHNNISPINLQHVPFLLQVGELDKAYKRNQATVEFAQKLKQWQQKHPKHFKHQVFVHWSKRHSYVADCPPSTSSAIVANPYEWLQNTATKRRGKAATNAIAWVNQYKRNPLPRHLLWDRNTSASKRTQNGALYYWLKASGQPEENEQVEVKINRNKNQLEVLQGRDNVTIYLTPSMIDFRRPIYLKQQGRSQKVNALPNLKTMIETLLQRGDPNFIFCASFTLKKKN